MPVEGKRYLAAGRCGQNKTKHVSLYGWCLCISAHTDEHAYIKSAVTLYEAVISY